MKANELAAQLSLFDSEPSRKHNRRLYTLDESYFQHIDTEEKAYWLGFLASDGNIHRNAIRIEISSLDRDILELLAQSLGSNRPIVDQMRPLMKFNGKRGTGERSYSKFIVQSKLMREHLASHGLTANKTFTVRPWQGPPELMRHYWRGVFDGDGSISKIAYQMRGYPHVKWALVLVGNEHMVRGFHEWAREVCSTRGVPHRQNTIWRFSVSGLQMSQELTRALYLNASIALHRKLEIATELLSLGDLGPGNVAKRLPRAPDGRCISTCAKCGKERHTVERSRRALCYSCARTGKSIPMPFKRLRSPDGFYLRYCEVCNAEIKTVSRPKLTQRFCDPCGRKEAAATRKSNNRMPH
jgi:hypothetical protein